MLEPSLHSFFSRQGSCATGGSDIWSDSHCQGESAVCQAKQDLVGYEKGKGSQRCWRCHCLEVGRLLCGGHLLLQRSWQPSVSLSCLLAEGLCWLG